MPGFLLHVGATVTCMHAGQAQPLTPNPRVMVGGQPIVTQNGSICHCWMRVKCYTQSALRDRSMGDRCDKSAGWWSPCTAD